ncbi:MAG: hypothetical protein AAF665_18475 [Pseudomonadota bacterium]
MQKYVRNISIAAVVVTATGLAMSAQANAQDAPVTNSSWYNSYAADAIAASEARELARVEARAAQEALQPRVVVIGARRHHFVKPPRHGRSVTFQRNPRFTPRLADYLR